MTTASKVLGTTSEKKSRANGRETREALVGAALALWSEEGLQGVTMEAVALRAGRTRRAAYHHFASQEALMTEARLHLKSHLVQLFDDDRHWQSDPYTFVTGVMASAPELVASYLQELLLSPPSDDDIMQKAIAFFRPMGGQGYLQPGFSAEQAAAICIGMWFSARLVVSMHEGKARRQAARDFAKSFERLLYQGMLTPTAAARSQHQREQAGLPEQAATVAAVKAATVRSRRR